MLRHLALIAFVGILLPPARTAVLYAARLPETLSARAADDRCNLPANFELQNLRGLSANGSAFASLDFTFYDNTTLLTTRCHLNATSKPVEIPGRTSRWTCDDPDVQFLFQDAKVTMVERLCQGADGEEDFEVSGGFWPVLPRCDGTRCPATGALACTASNGTVLLGRFTSVNPVPESLPPGS